MVGRVVAIGGGEMMDATTEPIDRHICETVGTETPSALFIPTASGDATGYCNTFDAYFGDRLGCETRHLTLVDEQNTTEGVRSLVDWADIVYVGGGSLPYLLDVWSESDVGDVLQDAYRNGTTISGLSAGAMCWFES